MNLDFAKSADRVLGSLIGGGLGLADRVLDALRPPSPVGPIERILVIKFWGLGNWALLRPIVRALRARYPGARLTIATLAGNAPLVRDLADDILFVRTDSALRATADLSRAVRFLRSAPHQLSLDFEQFSRSGALLGRLGGVPQRLGFRSGGAGRDGLYTVTIPFHRDRHASRSFLDLAESAGVPAGAYAPGGLSAAPEAVASLRERFTDLDDVVVLHPGSGDNFPGRRWSPAGFQAVGRSALRHGCRVVVTGGPGEVELARAVADGIGAGATSLAGRLSVAELVALLAGARALVANDTGPVHIASQLGVPVLAIYGPNTPVRYGPLSPGSRAFYRSLPCSPCLTNASYRSSRCRIHTCMDSIPTGAVTGALDVLLAGEVAEEPR